MDIEDYQVIKDQEKRNQEAVAIYHRYISQDSLFTINLASRESNLLKLRFEQGPPYPFDLFNEAKGVVFGTMLADPFPRFLSSCAHAALGRSYSFTGAVQIPYQLFEQMSEEASSNEGWEQMKDKNGIQRWRKNYNSFAVYCIRGRVTIDAPMQKIIDVVNDLDRRKEWDTHFHKGEVIKPLSEDVDILWAAWKFGTVKRDFVVMRMTQNKPNEHISLMSSVYYKDQPLKKGYTRTSMDASGFIISPSTNPNQSIVSYIVQVDPTTKVSKSVEDSFAKERPLVLSNLRSLLEKKK